MGVLLKTAHLFILFGGVFAWVLALGQLTLKKPRVRNYLMALTFFLLGSSQVSAGLPHFGIGTGIYHIIKLSSIVCFYFIGPLLYFYFQFILTHRFAFSRYSWVHFLPGAAAGFIVAAMLMASPSNAFDDYVFRDRLPGTAAGAAAFLLAVGAVLGVMGYMAVILLRMLRLLSEMPPERKRTILPALWLVIVIMAVSGAWVVYMLLPLPINEIIYSAESLAIIAIYLLGTRYPEYMQILKLEAERVVYERSQIKGLDVEFVLARLKTLMEHEQAFCDEDMSLKRLADEIGITPHQLSEVINSRLGKNFYSFINQYRVEEAERLLLAEPERPVLSIATAVGFETLSAFYTAFRKTTGMTPTRFRIRPKA